MKQFDSTQIRPVHWLIMIFVFLWSCFYLYQDTIHLYPSFVHAWTQSDRLALAMNFQQNGFDLFHPATFNLLTTHGITQVDFPIHDYLVAIISEATSLHLVTCFKLYNILYSLVGLFFIFKMTHLFTKSFLKSFLTAFFVFSLPFYAYYQAGFLPSVPSFANLFIGFYYLFQYQQKKRIHHFHLAVTFILLASLARLPMVIFLVATSILYALKWKKKKNIPHKELLPLSIAYILIIIYFIYNKYLAYKYGSMFLQDLIPIESFSQLQQIIHLFIDRWSGQIFGHYHLAFFLITIFICTLMFIFKFAVKNPLSTSLNILFFTSLLGVLIFFFAMGPQFVDHDYYLIDTFLPLIVMILIIGLSSFKIDKWYFPYIALCILFCIGFILESKTAQEDRFKIPYNDKLNYSVKLYQKSAEKLEEWNIRKEDTLLILNAYSTNIPFTIWNRKGYTVLNTSEKILKDYISKPFQHAVLIDSFRVSDIINSYPDIIFELDRVHQHQSLAIYKKTKNENEVGFFENFLFKRNFDFEQAVIKDFSGNLKRNYPNEASSFSLEILPKDEFSLAYKDTLNDIIPNKRMDVVIKADYLNQEDSSTVNLICHYGDFYQGRYFSVELEDSSEWQKEYFHFRIPANQVRNNKEIAIYYWNPGKSKLYIDNYSLLIFQ